MKQSEMLAVLKEFSSELNRYAAGSESIVPGAYAEALDKAIEMLEKERWISVNDRLPSREGLMDDETEYVLVRIKLYACDGYFESICGYTKDGWSEWDSFGSVRPEGITHWKPLDEKWG